MKFPNVSIKSFGKTTFALLRITRVGNVCMIAAGVFLGAFLVQGASFDWYSPSLLKAVAALSLLGAAGYVMNDLLDAQIDKINRPDRPLPSGDLHIQSAWILLVGLTSGAIGFSLTLPLPQQKVFLGILILLVAYNLKLSKWPLIGNLCISASVAGALLYGALPNEFNPAVWSAAFFAFTCTLAREIVKDVEDITGDQAGGANTLPVLIGVDASVRWVRALSVLIVLSSVLPYIAFGFGGLYLIIISVTDLLLLLPMSKIGNMSNSASDFSASLKWAMLFGMAALAFADSVPTN